MKPTIFLFTLAFICFACNSSDEQTADPAGGRKVNHTSLEAFADSLVRLDRFALESIDSAAAYYQRLVPADTSLADSAAVLFLRHITTVSDSVNQKLYKEGNDYFELIYKQNESAPKEQKQFQQTLQANHLLLQGDGEGGVYAVADYDWILQILTPKTSVAVDRYLFLLSEEEKNPTLLDAGLAIETSELADRLVIAEELAKQQLPFNFAEDVKRKNKFYLGTLLFGSDNSPALEDNETSITERFQKGYNYLLNNHPESSAAKMVAQWQSIVKAKNSQQVEAWREKYTPY